MVLNRRTRSENHQLKKKNHKSKNQLIQGELTMTNDRFIKYIPSENADWLREKYPYAFLLLSFIAQRARRYSGLIDGLSIGDAYIGDFQKAGIPTEAKYRTAKKVLVKVGAIKIKETNRRRNKEHMLNSTTIKPTTHGTLVTLLKSDIWDINSMTGNGYSSDSVANSQRLNSDEQEGRKKQEKMKKKNGLERQSKTEFCPKNSIKFKS